MEVTAFILCVLLVESASGYDSYYVKPNTNYLCPVSPVSPCETLDHYASHVSEYFTDNTSFMFLPGIHALSNSCFIRNIVNVTLTAYTRNVTIDCNKSGGLIFQHALHVKLVNLSFVSCGQPLPSSLQRDGETAQAALAFGQVTHLLLDSVTVNYSRGFGLLGHCVRGNFTITNSTFSYNNGSTQYLGGNAAIQYTNCSEHDSATNVLISSSNFTHGDYDGYAYTNYTGTLATGLTMIISQTNINVLIVNVIMDSNKNSIYKGLGGNLFVHFFNTTDFTSNNVTILKSKFNYGRSWLGGGIGMTFYTDSNETVNTSLCRNTLNMYHTEISQNTGIVGSGFYFEFQMKTPHVNCHYTDVSIVNVTFDANSVEIPSDSRFKFSGNGVAFQIVVKYHRNTKIQKISNHYRVLIERCSFRNSYLTNFKEKNNYTQLALPAITTILILNANNKIIMKDTEFKDNHFSAIGLYNSEVTFNGSIEIRNNTGINGGGLLLCDSSYIYLPSNTTLRLINNSAVRAGGGIYAEEKCFLSKPFCFYQLDFREEKNCSQVVKTVSIIMINNTASYAGDHIYGGALDNCKVNDCDSEKLFQSLFNISPNQTESNYSAVTSSPRKVCFCTEDRPSCITKTLNYTKGVYPGEKITVQVAILGQFNGIVPGTLLVHSQTTMSMPMPHTTEKKCKMLSITTNGGNLTHETIIVQVSSQISTFQSQDAITYLAPAESLHVNVAFKKCPVGFALNNNTCQCDQRLANEIECSIEKHTLIRTPPEWIGVNNQSILIYQSVCPYDYCVDHAVHITSNDTVFDQDAQCASNRTGFLCGKCKDGFSVSAGTSDCIKCRNKYKVVFFILGHAILGILLVAILVTFNITNTDGTFSGLLFYANVVNLNNYTFFPSHYRNILTYIISFIGLKSGYKSCLYDGMDSYGKAWLSFCFPVYLIVITAAIILLCRNSTRLAQLFGGNIIKVLATLFQLSYTKFLHNIVHVLSFTVVYYPSASGEKDNYKLHWLYDPSLRYFSGKHIPLALVAIAFGLLILAYTLVLLFVQPLQRYSHLPCLKWMAKLKPLIDAYTAPHVIKDNCRYWEGLLLLFRLILAIAFGVNVHGRTDTNLTSICLLCVLLLTIAWTSGGIYRQLPLNLLNLLSILNLGILSIVVSRIKENKYIFQNKNLRNPSFQITTYASFAIEAMLLVGVLSFHIFRHVFTWYERYRRRGYQTLRQDTAGNQPPLPPLRRFGD